MSLLIGLSERDITPGVGDAMAGSLTPRPARGTDDPLFVRALAVECGKTRFIHAVLDLCVLSSGWGDTACRRIAEQTGVPESNILWTCTHTHSGPDCGALDDRADEAWAGTANPVWLQALEDRFVECATAAWAARESAVVRRMRAYCNEVGHNRLLRHKSGRQRNTWLLNHPDDADMQCVGSAAPIDPEIGILAIENAAGLLRGVVWTYALHTNAHFGPMYSADYPASAQAALRKEFGADLFCMFLPGCCGDINPTRGGAAGAHDIGAILAGHMLSQLKNRSARPAEAPVAGFRKTAIDVPMHDFSASIEDRLADSRWSESCKPFFRETNAHIRASGATTRRVELAAWHLGGVSFATYPAEVFVEWGLELKRRGPVPWTVPVELTNGWCGYLPTKAAWESGGYEAIPSATSQIQPAGTQAMNRELLKNLKSLYRKQTVIG